MESLAPKTRERIIKSYRQGYQVKDIADIWCKQLQDTLQSVQEI